MGKINANLLQAAWRSRGVVRVTARLPWGAPRQQRGQPQNMPLPCHSAFAETKYHTRTGRLQYFDQSVCVAGPGVFQPGQYQVGVRRLWRFPLCSALHGDMHASTHPAQLPIDMAEHAV